MIITRLELRHLLIFLNVISLHYHVNWLASVVLAGFTLLNIVHICIATTIHTFYNAVFL